MNDELESTLITDNIIVEDTLITDNIIVEDTTHPLTPDNFWYKIFFVTLFLIISLSIGVAGYYYFAKLQFVDSLLNASMILGGMGPVDILPNNTSKIFASFYALYSGVIFIVLIAFLIDSIIN